MGRLIRSLVLLLAATLALPAPAMGFTGFGPMSADGTYGVGVTFTVELDGGAPDRLELLMRVSGGDGTLVAPVEAAGDSAEYVWDTTNPHVTPNTRVAYRWRATVGGRVILSTEQTVLYDDDRLDWQSARMGEATVHWYGGAEDQARRFGELTAEGADRAEELLGHEMSGPVDIFVYDSREDFFGALGPGAREWTGAATFPALRTIFMWLGGGPGDFLETTMVHEVTHVVFADATDNPYHQPMKWLNEGLASWSERQSADAERSTVEFEASGGGLFAFEAISENFPIGTRGSSLSYAQGATMVDMIVERHGREAIARMAEAYRDGASDEEALEAGTGETAEALYSAYYEQFGVDPPQRIEAEPIGPSEVRKPGAPSGPGEEPGATPTPGAEQDGEFPTWVLVPVALVLVVGVGLASWASLRRVRRSRHP
jgi:hypothetical protein